MSSVQTSYNKNIAVALLGLISDIGPYDIESFTNETGNLGFGLGVQFGANDNSAVLGSGAGGVGFLGISVRKTAKENTVVGVEEQFYVPLETMGIMRRGNVWVAMAAGGNPGDNVFVDDTTGVLNVGVSGAGESDVAVLQMTVAPGGLGIIRLND